MRPSTHGGASILLAVVMAAGQLASCLAKKHVVSLNARSFASEIKKHTVVAVDFYAPWCQHCQKLEPIWEQAAKKVAKSGLDVVLAKVNADEGAHKALQAKYAPQLPTVRVFRDGDLENPETLDLSKIADVAHLVQFLTTLARPASLELTSVEELEQVLEKEKVVVVALFPDAGAEAQKAAYIQVGNSLKGPLRFYHTTDASLLPATNPPPSRTPVVRVLTPHREDGFTDTHDFGVGALKEFVLTHSIPPVLDYFLSEDDVAVVTRGFSLGRKTCWVLLDINSTQVPEFRQALAEVANTPLGNGLLLMVGEDQENVDLLQNSFQLSASECPCILIIDPEDNGRYHQTHIQPADIAPFLTSFAAGELENRIKSQPIPSAEQNKGAVKDVVAKNFKQEVLNSGKNVLIKFYAPWCSYCKDLEPIFEEVALDLQEHDDIVTVQMDLTENDIPSTKFEATGYPTIFLYTKAGEVVKFEGERSKEEITAFVVKHMTVDEDEDNMWAELQGTKKDEL